MPLSIDLLLKVVDNAYDKKAWHGPTLRGALRGVGVSEASWRPSRRAHNIWELTVHAAYWKYAVRRMITGEKRGSFAVDGSNWFQLPPKRLAPREADKAWAGALRLLADEHRKLREAIATLSDDALGQKATGRAYSAGFAVRGIAAHDLYHAGQISLIKRMYKDRI
jgi:hypothetical protein